MQQAARDPHGKAAFDRIASERAGVDLRAVPPNTLDASYAVLRARPIPKNLAPYRDVIAALPGFDIRHLDHFGLYTDALAYANATLVARADRVRDVPELAAEGYALRSVLFAYGELLALRGRFPASVIARLRPGTGYRDLHDDLHALVVLFAEHPDVLSSGAPVTTADVDRANELVQALGDALGADTEFALSQDELAQERHKIAHLLITAHRELRRAAVYIRYHEGDAVALVPSLRVVTKGRPKQQPDAEGLGVGAEVEPTRAADDDGPFVDADV